MCSGRILPTFSGNTACGRAAASLRPLAASTALYIHSHLHFWHISSKYVSTTQALHLSPVSDMPRPRVSLFFSAQSLQRNTIINENRKLKLSAEFENIELCWNARWMRSEYNVERHAGSWIVLACALEIGICTDACLISEFVQTGAENRALFKRTLPIGLCSNARGRSHLVQTRT